MSPFATPGPIAATVEVAGARVRVTATDRTDTVVRVEPIAPGRSKDVKVAEKTKVDFTGGRLSVKTTASGDKTGSVAISIDLPAGSSLAAYLAHSQVHTHGPLGDSDLHMASGHVDLDHVAVLKANVSSGQVAVGHVTGCAEVDGGAFGLRIGEVQGAARIENAGGQAWIGHAHADLTLGSAGGDFDIDRADGNVT